MENIISLAAIKEELVKLEDEIINERRGRNNKEGSTFSYRLYEIRVEKNRAEEELMSEEERRISYKERFEDIVNQHQINIEDTLNRELCLIAIKAIHNARKWQLLL